MWSSSTSLVFKVERCEPEFVVPAKPTPHEYKQLSDIDDQESLRFQQPIIQFYEYNPSMEGRDPVKVIREAVSKTLVFYYPFAGRIREGFGRKLVVECTGKGILFIEGNADVSLHQFQDSSSLQPPFPCIDQLLYHVPNSDGILDSPLLLIQVTRLKYGGFIFIFAMRFNHTMCDGYGIAQFMTAIAEMARGAHAPSVLPVWQRALLNSRDPPVITYLHHEYDQVGDSNGTKISFTDIVQRSFFFGSTEISTILKTLPIHLRHCSSFELLSAYIWRLRTISLQLNPNEEVRFLCLVNLRFKFNSLPSGYYGNALASPAALTTAGKLCQNPLSYAVELVKKAKAEMTEEYIKSVADLMAIRERVHWTAIGSFLVSDLRKIGLGEVDFGWGKAIYGGPAMGGVGIVPDFISFFIPFKNREGEEGILVPMCLPTHAMERFVRKLDAIFKVKQPIGVENRKLITNIKSAL
ncbi:benzyl alcohol O-benzoyltransferase-like [Benincasa hispida]|uniref:benzyl alcohol O-benzoyltransferase-like n=1 Tax=Benincasa hispida TaxID=102211 RepID=UPI0019018A2C|nr:benzyl alcohol O-benzoyltransferase-like [Benincasa hispida]